jgi:predicted nucleic-acid-binding protein
MSYLADTNLIVRLLVRDDEEQFAATLHALKVLEQQKSCCYVPDIVWIESCWVLEKVYKLERKAISSALINLIHTELFIPLSDYTIAMLSQYGETTIDATDLYLSALAKSTSQSVLTWNHRDFRKLDCEWLAPSQIG